MDDLAAEFMERIRKRVYSKVRQHGDCLLWTGTVHTPGYGVIRIMSRLRGVHRVAYQLAHGPIPEAFDVHHTCGERLCLEPAHLEAISRREHNRITHRTVRPAP